MTHTSMRSRAAIAFAVLFMLGTACGTESGGGSGGAGAGTDAGGAYGGGGATSTPSGVAGGGEDDGGGGEDDGRGGEATATVQVNNFLFAPSDIEVAAGSEIEVMNGNANTPHTFTVEGTDIDLELSPMDSEDVTIDVDPGSYDVICRFHGQMTATLSVT
ncbi:MAG: cupredoxin domain-containing protein [Actinomycetota bacterium]